MALDEEKMIAFKIQGDLKHLKYFPEDVHWKYSLTLCSLWSLSPPSQNQRVGQVGRNRSGFSCPTSLLKQGPPKHVTQEGFWVSPGKENSQPLWTNCSIAQAPSQEILSFRWDFLCSSFCPLPFMLFLGTRKKSLAPSLWHPPFRHWQTLARSSLSHLFSRYLTSRKLKFLEMKPVSHK